MGRYPQSNPLAACLSSTVGAKRFSHNAKQTRQALSATTWFKDPLATAETIKNKHIGHPQFGTNIIDTPRQKIIREIISRRRRGGSKTNDERDDLYELGEEYLDLEHETSALLPSQDTAIERKINQILQQRFNYNPVALLQEREEGSRSLVEEDIVKGGNDTEGRFESSTGNWNRGDGNVEQTCFHGGESRYVGDDQGVSGVNDMPKSDEHTQSEDSERQVTPNVLPKLKNGVLPNGTLVTIDISEFNRTEETQDSTQSIFSSLDSININVDLLKLWTNKNIVYVIYFNKTVLPMVSSDPKEEYNHLRNKAAIFDKGYVFPMQVVGVNADVFLEHFVTCSLNKMTEGILQYTCIVDTKGFIMDTAYVGKTKDGYILMTNGLNKKNLYDYMTAYQVECRNSGLNISLKPLTSCTTVSLQGPKAVEVIRELANKQHDSGVDRVVKDTSVSSSDPDIEDHNMHCSLEFPVTPPPFMHSFVATFHYMHESENSTPSKQHEVLQCFRVSDVGEDGFEFLVSKQGAPHLVRLFLKHPAVCTAGFEVYDIGRMEAGIIRSDVDLPTEPSPIQAAVAWSIDKQKLRSGSLFGRQHLISQIINGVSKVRVGLIANQKVDSFCNILHNDTRMPIGFVTSCTWSYGLQMYIAQAYIRTEYARHDMPVCISMLSKPEMPLTKREFRKYYRNMTRRTFIRGTVVHLPFILHNYPIKQSERQFVGGRNVPLQSVKHAPVPKQCVGDQGDGVARKEGYTEGHVDGDEAADRMSTESVDEKKTERDESQKSKTSVKSRKQLWKEVIQAQRKKNSKTLEMALEQLEKAKTSSNTGESSISAAPEDGDLHISRINIRPRSDIPLSECIQYYKDAHSKPVSPRHRRYRPPVGQKPS